VATREQSGIYTITHLASGRVYVGQSQRIAKRLTTHRGRLRSGNHPNPKLQAAFSAYGEAAFAFAALEVCDVANLDAREQHWIDQLRPAFNLAPVAGNMRGYRFTDEQRAKIRKAFAAPECRAARSEARKAMWNTPGFRERASQAAKLQLTGKKQPPELIQKRTAWQAGTKRDATFCAKVSAGKLAAGFTFTEASRQKMREAQLGRKQSPETIAKRKATIAAKRAGAHHG
jgi:group I intron endonuclease